MFGRCPATLASRLDDARRGFHRTSTGRRRPPNLKPEIPSLDAPVLLGLDLGTTNVKALVTDRAGRPLGMGACPVRLFHVGEGGVEQDLEEIEGAMVRAIQASLRALDPGAVEAIGVSSQGGALQVLQADGRPLGRVLSWLDQRGRPFDDALTAELGSEWFRQRVGHGRSGMAIGQWLRFRQEQPDCVHTPIRLGFVGDLMVSRLCGRAAHDGTSCGLSLLYNPAIRDYDPGLLRRLGLETGQLPELVSPRDVAGPLRPEVARETGLRAGISVSAAIHDQYASALGSGAIRRGDVMVGTGTAWVLLAVSECLPTPALDDAFVCGHAAEGRYGQILSLVNGGSALAWAREFLGLTGLSAVELEALIGSAPPGSAGLRFWPFLVPGAAAGLAPGTRGRWSGMQLSHRAAHAVRSVIESLAFELNRHLVLLRQAGAVPERLVLSGGAASSAATVQMLADVTGLPLHVAHAAEASLLGAAILARGLLEPALSLADLVDRMVPPARSLHPGGDAPFYAGQFQDYLQSLPRPAPNPP